MIAILYPVHGIHQQGAEGTVITVLFNIEYSAVANGFHSIHQIPRVVSQSYEGQHSPTKSPWIPFAKEDRKLISCINRTIFSALSSSFNLIVIAPLHVNLAAAAFTTVYTLLGQTVLRRVAESPVSIVGAGVAGRRRSRPPHGSYDTALFN